MLQNRGKTASIQAKISDIGTEKNNKVEVSPIKASRNNAFHPDSLSINALSRELPQNVEAVTTLHDFDQMDQLVYHDEEEHQEELMDHNCHRITQKTTKNYIMQKVNTAFERKIAQTIRDSVLYGQTPTQIY